MFCPCYSCECRTSKLIMSCWVLRDVVGVPAGSTLGLVKYWGMWPLTMCGRSWETDYLVIHKLCPLGHLPLHHNTLLQMHQSTCQSPVILLCEQDLETVHDLEEQLTPNPEGEIHFFFQQRTMSSLGGCWLSSWLLHCVLKVTVWWGQQNHIICQEQRSNSVVSKQRFGHLIRMRLGSFPL